MRTLIGGLLFALLVVFVGAGCSQGSAWRITSTKGGYLVTLPAEIIRDVKDGAGTEVTIEDLNGKTKSSVSGTFERRSKDSFIIRTTETLPLYSLDSWLLLRIGPRGNVSAACSGCPRDATLQVYDPPEATICYWLHPE